MAIIKTKYINPKMLVWCRKSLNISLGDADKKLNSKTISIEEIEQGKKQPSFSQLKKLADYYKRPMAIFYLKDIPEEEKLPTDFRRSDRTELSRIALLNIRRAKRIQILYSELLYMLNRENPYNITYNLSPNENIENDVKNIRNKFSISIEDQLKWKNSRIAFNNWVEEFEKLGIIVLQMSIKIDELRAFSLYKRNYTPVIVVNSKDSFNGRIFSLFHEFCHILLNKDGICDMKGENGIEPYCNFFAGAFLVPKEILIKQSNDSIISLADKFKVSKEVILRRLLILKKINDEFYQKKINEWEKDWEENKKIKDKNKGFLLFPKKCIKTNGKIFTSLVLDAFYENKIDYSDVSDYLEVKISNYSVWY